MSGAAAIFWRMPFVRSLLVGAGCALVGIALTVWAGWIFQILPLTTFGGGGTPMGINAAWCMIAAGIGLGARNFDRLRLARLMAVIMGTVLLLTLLQALSGHDLGIDRLLWLRLDTTGASPPPMPFFAAAALSLLAVSLAVAPQKKVGLALWVMAGGALLLMSLLGLFSFLITLNSEQSWSSYRGIGLPFGLALALSALGLLTLIASRRGELGVTCCLMAAAVAVVLAVAATTRQGLSKFRAANTWVAHTLETEVAIERLGGSLARLDASMGAFVLTSGPQFLTQTETQKAEIRQQINGLASLFTERPAQQKRLHELEPLVEILVRQNETRARARPEQGAGTVTLQPGNAARDSSREATALIAEMRAEEQARRMRAFQEIHQTETYTKTLQVLAGSVAAILIGLAFWLAWRAALIRLAAEAALTEARDQALQHSRLKSEFLANMSHEIRTPMNGVIGMTSLLAETSITTEQREYVETIRVCGESLLILINDILDFSKIESGRIDLEEQEFDIVSCIDETTALFKAKAREKKLELLYLVDPSVPRLVVGDVTRVRQVVANLVSNAIKFTPSGRVEVAMRRLEGPVGVSCLLAIQVRDSGIGIPEEKRHRLFQPFSQVEASTNRRFGGTGLGLSISRRLSELMGGTLSVESTEGKGSIFEFTIRVGIVSLLRAASPAVDKPATFAAQPTLGSRSTAIANVADLAPLKILLAEDNSTNQFVAQRMMAKLGYRVDTVANGEEVQEAFSRQRYDVVLMDVQMPGIDGLEATKRLRRETDLKQPWIVAMTANAMTGDRELCLAAGMNDYVSKPVKLEELRNAMARAALSLAEESRARV